MPPEDKTTRPYYFTFGFGHAHPNGYVKIHASDEGKARSAMNEMFGMKWAFCHSEKDFLPQINRFNLYQVDEDYYVQV